MVEMGKDSGKVTADADVPFVVEGNEARKYKGKKYEDLYNVALYSAGERSNKLRGQRRNEGDEMETWQVITLTCVISVCVSMALFIAILCCLKKRGRSRLEFDPTSESE